MRVCLTCGFDITMRGGNAIYCERCSADRNRARLRVANKMKQERGDIRKPVQTRGRKPVPSTRACLVCGRTVRSVYADARLCDACRASVRECSDAMCDGADGDPACDVGWTMTPDLRGLHPSWREEWFVYIEE